MSTIWTPSGEYTPKPEPKPAPTAQEPAGEPPRMPPAGREPTPEEAQAIIEHAQYMLSVPVLEHVITHAMEMFQLAALHLDREGLSGERPDLAEARLAIDAFAALVEGLGEQLGPNLAPLKDALAQLRLAFVQVS
jgi:hypothetical protein